MTDLAKVAELLSPSEYESNKIALRKDISPIIEKSKTLLVVDDESHREAVALGRLLVTAQKMAEEAYKPIKKEIDKVKKIVLNDEKYDSEQIQFSKELLSNQILLYALEQNKKRKDLEEKIRALDDSIPVIIQTPPKPEGQIEKTTYSAEVVNFKELVTAVANEKAPLESLEANMSFLNSQATDYKEGLNIPGVRVDAKKTISFRS